ncbi:hypothetical protein [Streptacidiphilus sp. EB103A]|uniref:hypothetical protein n=1 Tax=Streptacidiphilus sp. EB103A TaxID=3156275 RepID=UPI0035166498
MDAKELHRHCTQVVDEIVLPVPFDVNALVDLFEEERDRPISLMPMPGGFRAGSPCGLWVATDDCDYILYGGTRKAHQVHIILHELAHMRLGHKSSPADQDELAQLLMPTLNPALVRSVLGRTAYTTQEERAAELVATMLTVRAGRVIAPVPRADVDPGMANLVQHLGAALERNANRKN